MNIVERLRQFGPEWSKKFGGHIIPYEVCVDAAKALEAAAYYIDRLERCDVGKPVRDLDEAQSAYLNSLKPTLTK